MNLDTSRQRAEGRQAPRTTLPVLSPSPATPSPVAATQPREDDFLSPLRGMRVRVVSTSGQSVTGHLVGIARYEIKVREAEGAELVIGKGNVWSVAEVRS